MSTGASVSYVALGVGIDYVTAEVEAFLDFRGLYPVIAEAVSVSSNFTRVATYFRDFSEALAAVDAPLLNFARPVSSSVSISAARVLTPALPKTETITPSVSAPTFVGSYILTDTAATGSSIIVAILYTLAPDTVVTSETFNPLLAIGLPTSSYSVTDALVLNIASTVSDSASTAQTVILATGLSYADTATATETIDTSDFTFGLLPTDTVATAGVFGYTSERVTSSVINAVTLGSFGLNV